MTENKYEKAFYEWVKLGDKLMEGVGADEWEDTFELYREKSKAFESAFPKAERWDLFNDNLGKYCHRDKHEILCSLEGCGDEDCEKVKLNAIKPFVLECKDELVKETILIILEHQSSAPTAKRVKK